MEEQVRDANRRDIISPPLPSANTGQAFFGNKSPSLTPPNSPEISMVSESTTALDSSVELEMKKHLKKRSETWPRVRNLSTHTEHQAVSMEGRQAGLNMTDFLSQTPSNSVHSTLSEIRFRHHWVRRRLYDRQNITRGNEIWLNSSSSGSPQSSPTSFNTFTRRETAYDRVIT